MSRKFTSKKYLSLLLVLALLISLALTASAQEPVKVTIDGQFITVDVPPTIIDGRTLVPVRAIFESLGVEVDWDESTRTVIGTKGSIKIELPIDNKYAKKSGQNIELDVPATIIDGRTLVPTRFIAESLGCNVDWDGNTRTVIISSNLQLKVHYIDVGQGDAIFIDYGDYDILIDAGDNEYGISVVNYLKLLNIDDIEILVATHPDADHIGGLDDVLKAFDVEKVIDSGTISTTKTYQDYMATINAEKVNGAEFIYDDNFIYDLGNGVKFEVIETGDNNGSNNGNSVVTRLVAKNVEFLFTGDMDSEVEAKILDRNIQSDILKVGHHGSRYSSSREFLSKVRPKIAVISAGLNNTYGHPHEETLTGLKSYTDYIYGTWLSGNIIISTDGNTYQANTSKTISVKQEPETPVNDSSTNNSNTKTSSGVIIKSINLQDEIVVIENPSNSDVDLTGWKLVSVEGNQVYNFPSGYALKAGFSIKIASGKATGDLKWTGAYIWNNGGDSGELYDALGNLISKK